MGRRLGYQGGRVYDPRQSARIRRSDRVGEGASVNKEQKEKYGRAPAPRLRSGRGHALASKPVGARHAVPRQVFPLDRSRGDSGIMEP